MSMFIIQEASPNALQRINSPLPRYIEYQCPLCRVGYTTSMSVFGYCYLRCTEIGDFLVWDKAWNASEICKRAQLFAHSKVIYISSIYQISPSQNSKKVNIVISGKGRMVLRPPQHRDFNITRNFNVTEHWCESVRNSPDIFIIVIRLIFHIS